MRIPLKVSIFFLSLNFFILNHAHAVSRSNYEDPNRLVAIGDIHGDGHALKHILKSMQLIDAQNNWIGGDTMLIMVGDILDRGQNSRAAVDLLIQLESQAKTQGGHVIALMGNHEFMVASGDLRYFHEKDALNYSDFQESADDDARQIVLNAFSGKTQYGKWLRSLPAMVKVGRKLFVHAGVESWIKTHSVHEINTLLSKWIHHCQFKTEAPPANTQWVIDETGPLWTRRLAYGDVKNKKFQEWLDEANADHLIVGHTITETHRPSLQHEKYGSSLIMIDSAISSAYANGNLSALEWTKETGFQSHTFARPKLSDGATQKGLRFHQGDGIDDDNDTYRDCIEALKRAA